MYRHALLDEFTERAKKLTRGNVRRGRLFVSGVFHRSKGAEQRVTKRDNLTYASSARETNVVCRDVGIPLEHQLARVAL